VDWALSRSAASLLGGLCAVGGFRLPATADRAHDDLDREPEDDQVTDHLPGDHEPRRLGMGRDVAEPDGGEHGDGEVQPVGVCQPPVEVASRHRGHGDVGAGEQQQEQRNAGGQGFDGPQAREGDRRIERAWTATSAMNTASPMTRIVTAVAVEEWSRGSR
jgi:hypothetical protein